MTATTGEWEKEFDAGHNTQNISDPASDTQWVKSFIRTLIAAEREKAREKEKENTITATEIVMSEQYQDCIARSKEEIRQEIRERIKADLISLVRKEI